MDGWNGNDGYNTAMGNTLYDSISAYTGKYVNVMIISICEIGSYFLTNFMKS